MEGQVGLQRHGAAGHRKDLAETEAWADPRAARPQQPGSPLPRIATKGPASVASCLLLVPPQAPLAVLEVGPCAMPSTPRALGPQLLWCGPGAAA